MYQKKLKHESQKHCFTYFIITGVETYVSTCCPRAVPELCLLYNNASKNAAELLLAVFSAMEILLADSLSFSQFLVN